MQYIRNAYLQIREYTIDYLATVSFMDDFVTAFLCLLNREISSNFFYNCNYGIADKQK